VGVSVRPILRLWVASYTPEKAKVIHFSKLHLPTSGHPLAALCTNPAELNEEHFGGWS
jgi:hypothetical protein